MGGGSYEETVLEGGPIDWDSLPTKEELEKMADLLKQFERMCDTAEKKKMRAAGLATDELCRVCQVLLKRNAAKTWLLERAIRTALKNAEVSMAA